MTNPKQLKEQSEALSSQEVITPTLKDDGYAKHVSKWEIAKMVRNFREGEYEIIFDGPEASIISVDERTTESYTRDGLALSIENKFSDYANYDVIADGPEFRIETNEIDEE